MRTQGEPSPPSAGDDTPTGGDATTVGGAATPTEGAGYLLVVSEDSSTRCPLPTRGELSIGRDERADIRLKDSSVSRRHARIDVDGGTVLVTDLESENGTYVNGERIIVSRRLLSGDVITISGFTLVYRSTTRPHTNAPQTVAKFDQLRRRAEEEIERCVQFGRSLALFVVALGENADRERIAYQLVRGSDALRSIDMIGSGGADQLIVLAPECDAAHAADAARRLCDAARSLAPTVRVGHARCPADGADFESLLAGAREATLSAGVGEVKAAAGTYQQLELGNRTFIVADAAMVRLFGLLKRLAASNIQVLVCGETGTGKEMAAAAVHYWSARKDRELVAFNCAAIAESLIESELFGYERGAYTGAAGAKPGLLERASGGTLFLDEIGETSPSMQAKLLRVLETGEITRIGDSRPRTVDLRLVAATNRNLLDEVKAGRFRQDLFFRLGAATIWLPPLRERRREIPILAHRFLEDAVARVGGKPPEISDAAMQLLCEAAWPGNVRELRNVMEYIAAAFAEPIVQSWHIELALQRTPTSPSTESIEEPEASEAEEVPPQFRPIEEQVEELERTVMSHALAAARGNQRRAAELIAMPLRTFQAKVKRYGMSRRGGG